LSSNKAEESNENYYAYDGYYDQDSHDYHNSSWYQDDHQVHPWKILSQRNSAQPDTWKVSTWQMGTWNESKAESFNRT